MNIATPEWSSKDLVLIPQSVSKVKLKKYESGKSEKSLSTRTFQEIIEVKSQISQHPNIHGMIYMFFKFGCYGVCYFAEGNVFILSIYGNF